MKHILLALVIAAAPSAFADNKKATKPLPSNPSMISDSSYSYSSNYKYEADLNLSQGLIHSYKLGNDTYTDINVNVAFHYTLNDHMQVGGEGGLLAYRDTATSNKMLVSAMGVFTYNLDTNFKNSLFGDVGAGLTPAYDKTAGNYGSKFSFFFDIGKRFPLWDHVSYKPLFRLAKNGDQDMEFTVLALNVSLSF